jgi:hypothetical protein
MEDDPLRKLYLLLSVAIIVFLSGNYCFAQDREYTEAKTYLLKVFNSTYIIPNNNARTHNKLIIDKCDIKFSFTIDGSYDRQSCNMKYLDHNRIERFGGSINILTTNEESRVEVSNSKYKSAVLSLHYDTNKYSEDKIISSLKKVIARCNKEEGAKQAVSKTDTQQTGVVSQNTNRKSSTPKSKAPSNVVKRQLIAKLYSKELSDKGLAHSVFSTGADHTTLLINKIQMSEELINGIMTDQSFLSELRKIGFKQIDFCEASPQGGINCKTFLLK